MESKQSRGPTQARAKATRAEILGAAKELFELRGYARTKIKDIAERAGIAVGSVYMYFPDKSAVFLEIISALYRDIFNAFRLAMDDANLSAGMATDDGRREVLRSLVGVLYRAHEIEPGLHREIDAFLLASSRPGVDEADKLYREIKALVETLNAEVISWLRPIVATFLPPSRVAAGTRLVFWAAEAVIHRLKQDPETGADPEEMVEELCGMIGEYLFHG